MSLYAGGGWQAHALKMSITVNFKKKNSNEYLHNFWTIAENYLGYNKSMSPSKSQACLSIGIGCFSDEQSGDNLYHLTPF